MLGKERELTADEDRYIDNTKRSDTEQKMEGVYKVKKCLPMERLLCCCL
jgi:hypothetical protein